MNNAGRRGVVITQITINAMLPSQFPVKRVCGGDRKEIPTDKDG